MDLSGLIFVALAVAWAVYLIPKALRHHEDVVRTRSVDRFSHTMRVVARREPVNRRTAQLVVTPDRPTSQAVVAEPGEVRPEVLRARRAMANRAARRRRRVLLTLLLANVAVVAGATAQAIEWYWAAAPAAVLFAWLVACRLMVRRERAWTPALAADIAQAFDAGIDETAERPAVPVADADTDSFSAVGTDPALWDPVPVTLPTYVSKSAATRTVRTIDLDDTGVWTSGRSEADSQLARDAEEAERADRADRAARSGSDDRAVGS